LSSKQWIKIALDFTYLINTFPRISDAKIKNRTFGGPQIKELIQDAKFEDRLTEVQKAARKSFKYITINFWGGGGGNVKAENLGKILKNRTKLER